MQFNVEMSIIRHASNLTKFRVTGQLPLLKANFSDRKYKIIMNIIEKITPQSTNESTESIQFPTDKFSFNEIVEEVLKDKPKGKKPMLSKNMANKALAWKQKDTIAEKLGLKTPQDLVIDSSSEGEENDESHEDKPEEFFDAQDTDVYKIILYY